MTTALATRLKRARTECGITEPADAARRAGITASALYQLEDGKETGDYEDRIEAVWTNP